MKHNSLVKVIGWILILMFLSACWNAKSIEQLFYAHSIGVDYRDDKYWIYLQIVNFSGASPGQNGGGGEQPSEIAVGVGKGDTFAEAVHDLYPATQRRVFWGHLSSIIFTENALRHQFMNTLDTFNRFNESRPTLWIYATDQSPEEALSTMPVAGQNAIFSYLGEPWESYEQSVLIQPIKMNRLIASINEPGKTTLLPMIRVAGDRWINTEEQVPNLLIDDIAVIQDKQFKGSLTEDEMLGVRWIQGVKARTPIIVKQKDKAVATFIATSADSKITPNMNEGMPTFDIQTRVKGYVIELKKEVTKNYLEKQLKKKIKEQIERTFQAGLEIESDIYSFSHVLYKKNPEQWDQLEEKGYLNINKESLSSINVEINIDHAGSEKLLLE
ncbi:Ger(x)C family germination protein [Melghiribacillus thermohalophilus]|uniref:Ger(X)C family germination protein n=1 Tax=Melghiribacillus thermohalophilus TaxID=1324956 RepID=A0A4R3N975_9BACI|nr:Ger(x)C family spore germination protein [Melghiribacillus thermohalophilus]TCT25091.1 Ger(x)C family germination protein [Melghiribacillus thermohalophilus]